MKNIVVTIKVTMPAEIGAANRLAVVKTKLTDVLDWIQDEQSSELWVGDAMAGR